MLVLGGANAGDTRWKLDMVREVVIASDAIAEQVVSSYCDGNWIWNQKLSRVWLQGASDPINPSTALSGTVAD